MTGEYQHQDEASCTQQMSSIDSCTLRSYDAPSSHADYSDRAARRFAEVTIRTSVPVEIAQTTAYSLAEADLCADLCGQMRW